MQIFILLSLGPANTAVHPRFLRPSSSGENKSRRVLYRASPRDLTIFRYVRFYLSFRPLVSSINRSWKQGQFQVWVTRDLAFIFTIIICRQQLNVTGVYEISPKSKFARFYSWGAYIPSAWHNFPFPIDGYNETERLELRKVRSDRGGWVDR